MEALLKTRSLRFWIALSMSIAILPLIVSAVVSYFVLNHGVIDSFQDVLMRERTQIAPTQRLRLDIANSLVPVDEFIEDGDPVHQRAYREARTRIETEFAALGEAVKDEPAAYALVQRARDEWTTADRQATELISVQQRRGDPAAIAAMHRFHGEIAAATDKLAAVHNHLDGEVQADHDVALLFYERAIWTTSVAGIFSLLAIAGGVFLIGRIMVASVDRLVDGAVRFADGDRGHRIDVQIPPELHRVAEEFNHMIGRINESEEVLAELARRDSLTGLANRRAFDESLSEAWARVERFREQVSLLAIDIDHFKEINDTYGHAAGDAVLRAIAHTMTGQLRLSDKLFRSGGEEFSAILPGTNSEEGRETAERIRKAIAACPIQLDGTDVTVTVSVGIASAQGFSDPGKMVEAADAALYDAKLHGRDRVAVDRDGRRKNRTAA